MVKNGKKFLQTLMLVILCILAQNTFATLDQYTVQRLQIYTGGNHPTSLYWQDMYSATYNAGRVIPTWNYNSTTYADNNLSTPQALPFAFSYDHINCNYFYISTNGFLVLDTISSSTLTSKSLPMYASNTTRGRNAGTASQDTAYNGNNTSMYHSYYPVGTFSSNYSYSARIIAPFYTDLKPGLVNNTPSSLAADICWYYSPGNIVTGDTMVIVEWRQLTLAAWTGNYRRCWFQARLHKTTGIIEFYYQWMANQYTGNYPQNYVCGLNSATYNSSPTYANIFTQTTANTATFGASLTTLLAHEAQNYKLVFTKVPPSADLAVTNISPPLTDTCGWSSSQVIVDSITNLGNSLDFTTNHLWVYSKIIDSVNGAVAWTYLDSGSYTGTLAANTTIGIQMLHPQNFSLGGQYTIKSYTKDSVHAAVTSQDNNINNDTSTITIYNSRVTATADATSMCAGSSTYLHASPTINHSSDSTSFIHYTKMPFSAPSTPTHQITTWTGGSNDGTCYLQLPFTFKYFGMSRSALYVCSNGFVEFECAYTTPTMTMPDQSTAICPYAEDAIGIAWADLRLDLGGSVYWDTVGTSPNREFVIRFNRVYDSTNTTAVSAYMILHETTNLIEFQNDTVPVGSYTQGIQDSAANIAYFLSSRNANTWSATRDAYLFASQPTYTWTSSPNDASLTSSQAIKQNPLVSPTVTTTYTVIMNAGNTGYPDSIGICPKTATITVTITPGLGNVPVPTCGATTLCQNTNTYFNIPPVTNATSYSWSVSNTIGAVITTGQGTDSITVTFGQFSGWVKVTAFYAGCGTSASDSVYVTVVQGIAGQWVGGIDTGWFKPLNWCGGVPTSTTDVTIDGTNPVTPPNMPVINGFGAVANSLYMDGNYDTLTILGSNNLDIYGDWYNGFYSTFSYLNPNNSTITFKGNNTPNVITGMVSTTFNNININKGYDTTFVVENTQPTTINMTGSLTLTNGLFRISEQTSSIQYTGASPLVIPSTSGIELNGGKFFAGNYSITNYGLFRMTVNAADDTLGTTTGNSITSTGTHGFMDIQGGKLTIASQIIIKSGAKFSFSDLDYVNATGNQDTIILNRFGTSSNTQALLEVDATSSIFLTDGYFIFHNPNSGSGLDLRLTNGAGTKFLDVNNFSTFQFGDATTSSSSATFKIVDTAGLVFNNITINPAAGHDTLYMYSPVSLNTNGTLALNSGILKLNGNILTLNNSNNTAITRSTGFVISESSNVSGAIKWNIPIDNSAHRYPFGNNSGSFIPFYIMGTGGTGTYMKVATYAPTTNTIAHLPYPPTVTHIRNSAGVNDSAYMVNRFWQIDADTSIGHPTVTLYFKYAASEAPAINNTTALNAQRWNAVNTGWFQPSSSQSWVGGASDSVRTPNISNFSPWTLSQVGHALPIDLFDFSAIYNGLNVDINWTTASESNNEYFTVRRTVNNKDFDIITTIPGAGTANVFNYYHTIDSKPLAGLSFYQIMQTDFDGQSKLSELKPITIGAKVFEIRNIFANHDEGTIHILLNNNESDNVNITLSDLLGNIITRQKTNILNSSSDIKLNVGSLPLGLYFITIQGDTKVITRKAVY